MKTATVTAAEEARCLTTIYNAPPPAVSPLRLRPLERRVWAAQIRRLLASLGITGVRVTTPSYSQAHTVRLTLPCAAETCDHWTRGAGMYDCPVCAPLAARRDRARRRLSTIILTAFPDLADRSAHSVEDSHDFCFTIA